MLKCRHSLHQSLFVVAMLLTGVDAGLTHAQESANQFAIEPDLPYLGERGNAVTYDVDFSIVVTPPYKAQKLQVWLPMPTTDAAQEVTEGSLSSFPMSVEPAIAAEPVYGNRFAYFEFKSPQGAQVIRHQFKIRVWELNWRIDPTKVQTVSQWPKGFAKYQQGDSQSVILDERFETVLNEIVPQRTNPFQDFGGVLDWVQGNVAYDHHDASLKANSEHVLTKRRGHCSDYHSFCASLGRELGVPTRVTYGINAFPKNSPSHCKLEAFIAPYGWVSFDVSETQKLVAEIKKAPSLNDQERSDLTRLATARLMSGFRDNTWFLQTRGTDYDLVPAASKRVPVVRTAWIEADGVPLSEPDPADKSAKGFSWMTVHEYSADNKVPYPFADWTTLRVIE